MPAPTSGAACCASTAGRCWRWAWCAGYLGAAPTLLWAASAATLVFAPLLLVVSVWLYTLVFAFAACLVRALLPGRAAAAAQLPTRQRRRGSPLPPCGRLAGADRRRMPPDAAP